MEIYIDGEFKCHTAAGAGRRAVKTDFFQGCAPGYLEGYRFIPAGECWTRADGAAFQGEMACPWRPWEELDRLQRAFEREQHQLLTRQNAELTETVAEMVEKIYNLDAAMLRETE